MRATCLYASAAFVILMTALSVVSLTAADASASPGLAPQYTGGATGTPETVVESIGSPLWVFGLIAAIACVTTIAVSSIATRTWRAKARGTFA